MPGVEGAVGGEVGPRVGERGSAVVKGVCGGGYGVEEVKSSNGTSVATCERTVCGSGEEK